MEKNPMDDIRDAGRAAREGMGLEETPNDQESVEIDSPEQENEEVVTTEPESQPEEEQESEESEEPEEEPAPQPRDRSVFRQLNEIRSQKRQEEQEKKQLLELIGASSLEEAQAKMGELRAAQPLSPEFIEAAREMGIEDPETLKKVSDLIVGQVKKEFAPIQEKISEQASTVEQVKAEREFNESLQHFDGEWKQVLPEIESVYKPTATQLEKAYEFLAEVAHNEEYFDKDLDYVVYKEREQLEGILGAPKRKTMLSSRGQAQAPRQEGVLVRPDGSHDSFIKARARMKSIAGQSEFDSEEEGRV